MNALTKAVVNVRFDAGYDRQAHKDIYSHITQNILKVVTPNECPPFPIIIYTIQNIISPVLIISEIPSLLDLLAHVERTRQHAVKVAREALEWNTFYTKTRRDDVLLLSDEERPIIERAAAPSKDVANRKIYLRLVFDLSELHIHSLWNSDEKLLAECMREYFPALTNSHSNRLFHSDLTDDERKQLSDRAKRVVAFLVAVSEWETQLEAEWIEKGYIAEELYMLQEFVDEHARLFAEKFPKPIPVTPLCQAVEKYAKGMVRPMVDHLQSIFSVT